MRILGKIVDVKEDEARMIVISMSAKVASMDVARKIRHHIIHRKAEIFISEERGADDTTVPFLKITGREKEKMRDSLGEEYVGA